MDLRGEGIFDTSFGQNNRDSRIAEKRIVLSLPSCLSYSNALAKSAVLLDGAKSDELRF